MLNPKILTRDELMATKSLLIAELMDQKCNSKTKRSGGYLMPCPIAEVRISCSKGVASGSTGSWGERAWLRSDQQPRDNMLYEYTADQQPLDTMLYEYTADQQTRDNML